MKKEGSKLNFGIIFLFVVIIVSFFYLSDVYAFNLFSEGTLGEWNLNLIPNETWEFKNQSFILNASFNSDANSILCLINLSLNHSTPSLAYAPQGWSVSYNTKNIVWSAKNESFCINNSYVLFNFTLISHTVDKDTLFDQYYSLKIVFPQSNSFYIIVNDTLNLTIKNDSIRPNLTSVYPPDWSFVKNGTINFTFIFKENESGLNSSSAELWWVDGNNVISCADASNWNGVKFICKESDGIYNCSYSKYLDGPYFNYRIEIEDNAGNKYNEGNDSCSPNQTYLPHTLYVDSKQPNIYLIFPNNSDHLSGKINFTFNVSDNSFDTVGIGNFKPTINCSLLIQNQTDSLVLIANWSYQNVSKSGNNTLVLMFNVSSLTDGNYTWWINCTDAAGWKAESEHRWFYVDTHGPIIGVVQPLDGSYHNSSDITLNISAYDWPAGIDVCWYDNGSQNITMKKALINSSCAYFSAMQNFSKEGNHTITFYCNDTAGNINLTTVVFTIDITQPNVSIVWPLNNSLFSSTNYSMLNFTCNVSDNIALDYVCIYTNQNGWNSKQCNNTVNNGLIVFNLSVNDGSFIAACYACDKAGNCQFSNNLSVIVERGPAIKIIHPENKTYTSNVNYVNVSIFNFMFDKFDISVIAEIDGVNYTLINQTNNNDQNYFINTSLNIGNGLHYVKIYTNDSLNNTNTSTVWFTVQVTQQSSGGGGGGGSSKSCVNECIAGSRKCVNSSYYVVCGNYDSDTCYEWSSPIACVGNCINGNCVCIEQWNCSEWSECINGTQTRECIDLNACGTSNQKPETVRPCEPTSQQVAIQKQEQKTPQAGITGFAIARNAKAAMPFVIASVVWAVVLLLTKLLYNFLFKLRAAKVKVSGDYVERFNQFANINQNKEERKQ